MKQRVKGDSIRIWWQQREWQTPVMVEREVTVFDVGEQRLGVDGLVGFHMNERKHGVMRGMDLMYLIIFLG